MQRFLTISVLALGVVVTTTGCSHNHSALQADPAVLAAMHADVRLVGSETTWVTHGNGYELVGRTRADLAILQPGLDRAAAFLAQIYPHDSLAPVVASVKRVPAPGKPLVAAAPVPADAKGLRVELALLDPKALDEQRKRGVQVGDPVVPAVRAWLSARASRLAATPGSSRPSRNDVDNPRVPEWAVEMATSAGNDALIDESTKSLAAHLELVIPLEKYFVTDPGTMDFASGRRGGGPAGGGASGGGGGAGGMGGGGGMGGRGGMSGGGRMGGRGGGRSGGGGAPSSSSRKSSTPQGPALFAAQAAVLTKYFARAESDIIGELIDARLMGKSIEDAFARHNMTAQQVDADWRTWLTQRAAALNHS